MVAVAEARALLDALMGGDRNAPLPKGAAIPGRKRKQGADGGDMLLLPGKRNKSCYDPDICPLYTAWGRDVYELFVNTKSDLGPNPYVADDGAHQEYLNLPREEKERLGYDYFLFQKLNELVRQCDRTVSRNNEKLRQEMARKGIQRADVPEQVDDGAVEHVCRIMLQVEDLQEQLSAKITTLEGVLEQEDEYKSQLEPILQERKLKEESKGDADDEAKDATPEENDDNEDSEAKQQVQDLQMKLGGILLEKNRLLFEISQLMTRLVPLQDDVAYHRRQLDYVKSDITTDKTVCEVSGNFMSARDADERIAAHYAGKQYVGWRLVRDKLASMQKVFGRYGPPPPAQRRNDGPPPSMAMHGGGGGGGGFRGGGGGGRNDGRGERSFGGGGGGGGRFNDRDRGGFRGPPPPGRYEDRGFRGGPPQGGRRW